MIRLLRTESSHQDFINLVGQLDAHLAVADGDKHEFYHQFNGIDNIPFVLVAFLDNRPVACGAMKPFGENALEIKRMYTLPEERGKGLGEKILIELQNWAQQLQYQELVLETGHSFIPAIALYEKHGFKRIPNYGQYADVPSSICFHKTITPCNPS